MWQRTIFKGEKIPYTEYKEFEKQFKGWITKAGERNTKRKNKTGSRTLPLLNWEKILQQIEPNNSKCNPKMKVCFSVHDFTFI